ncbi:hypothetical protein BGZ72_002265 [Mortierella alpina]|nr:hypothetical protein BGZ72_002265 [Mortierella alpina]
MFQHLHRPYYSFLDKQELPHVVPYEVLDQKAVPELISKLTNEGLHVSPQETTAGTTMETILNKGLAEKEKMVATAKPAAAPAPAAAAPGPNASQPLGPTAVDDKKTTVGDKKTVADDNKIKTPETENQVSPVEKANSASKLTVGVVGVAFGILPWIL